MIVGNFILNSKSKVKFYPTKKFKYKCLVLDQHVKTSWYFKSINPLINETNHKIFLNNVIKLSNKFPDILFVVKSKDEDWKDDKIYRPLFKKLNRMKNLRLFKNKKYIQNLDLLNSFDFALGKPTSILDDFLSYGKPIVVFDNDHRTKYTIKYPNEIFTDDYFNLELKIEKILSDYDKIMNKLNKTKNFFFKKFDKNNYEKILNKILDEKDKL